MCSLGVSPGCHPALLWQRTNLKKKQQLKEFVPEGLTQGRAENLGAVMFPFCLPTQPCFFPPVQVPEKKKTKQHLSQKLEEKKSLIGITDIAKTDWKLFLLLSVQGI